MPRLLVGALLCLAVESLSCGSLFPGESRALSADRLVAGGGARPEVARAPAEDPDETLAEPSRAASLDPDRRAAAIERYLRTRHTGLTGDEIERLAHTIVREADRQQLDVGLVMAVMHVESRFYNFALSPVGAIGLMQILPSTGEELAYKTGVPWRGALTLLDPDVNVRLGAAYLRELSNRYGGDMRAALAAYNWGPGHIDRRLQNGGELPSYYPGLVMNAHAQRTSSFAFSTVTSSDTKRSTPLIAASSEPR